MEKRLKALKEKHKQISEQAECLERGRDTLAVAALKKHKLRLKDAIAKIEREQAAARQLASPAPAPVMTPVAVTDLVQPEHYDDAA